MRRLLSQRRYRLPGRKLVNIVPLCGCHWVPFGTLPFSLSRPLAEFPVRRAHPTKVASACSEAPQVRPCSATKKRTAVPLRAHRLLDFRFYLRTDLLLGFRKLVARL